MLGETLLSATPPKPQVRATAPLGNATEAVQPNKAPCLLPPPSPSSLTHSLLLLLPNGHIDDHQAAMQHFLASSNVSDASEVQDPGIKVLMAQCMVLLGEARHKEAAATRVRGSNCWVTWKS